MSVPEVHDATVLGLHSNDVEKTLLFDLRLPDGALATLTFRFELCPSVGMAGYVIASEALILAAPCVSAS